MLVLLTGIWLTLYDCEYTSYFGFVHVHLLVLSCAWKVFYIDY